MKAEMLDEISAIKTSTDTRNDKCGLYLEVKLNLEEKEKRGSDGVKWIGHKRPRGSHHTSSFFQPDVTNDER